MLRRDEQRAFEAFVVGCSGRLMGTAYLLCGDRGHAEDLVQTALMRTARRWSRAQPHPEAFARRVLVNLAKDRWRSLGRRVAEVTVDVDLAAPSDDGVLERQHLLDSMRSLSDGQRAVLVLRYFADLSVTETARTLGCSEGTVKSQTSRALDRIRDVLEHEKETADVDR